MILKIYKGIEIQVDEEDLIRIKSVLKPRCQWYYCRRTNDVKGWCAFNGLVKKVSIHRVIMDCILSTQDVDHINGDRKDNRKSNLRVCSHQENLFNVRCIGTYFDKSRNKWQAKIRTKQGRKFLGRFDTELEAKQAYRKASIEFHGEFSPYLTEVAR